MPVFQLAPFGIKEEYVLRRNMVKVIGTTNTNSTYGSNQVDYFVSANNNTLVDLIQFMNESIADGYSVFYFRKGTYNFREKTSGIKTFPNNIIITGEGTSTIIDITSTIALAVNINFGTNTILSNLVLRPSNISTTLQVSLFNNTQIKNCTIGYLQDGALASTTGIVSIQIGATVENILFDSNYFYNTAMSVSNSSSTLTNNYVYINKQSTTLGFGYNALNPNKNMIITGNTFIRNIETQTTVSVSSFISLYAVLFSNNYVKSNYYSNLTEEAPGVLSVIGDAKIMGNKIFAAYQTGIVFSHSSTAGSEGIILINGNYIEYGVSAVRATAAVNFPTSPGAIVGNQLISLTNYAPSIYLQYIKDTLVAGNYISSINQTITNNNGTNNTIVNNEFY